MAIERYGERAELINGACCSDLSYQSSNSPGSDVEERMNKRSTRVRCRRALRGYFISCYRPTAELAVLNDNLLEGKRLTSKLFLLVRLSLI